MAEQALEPCRSRKRPRGHCSSSSAAMGDYDVFLNHHGPDVKAGFIAHLHDALRSAGLNPFLDKKSLVQGEPAFGSIDEALEVARVHVAVVSRGYAESKYCLTELVAMMRSGMPVIPVFYDVEPAQLRRVESGPFAAAFEKHKLRERAEQVEEWADALAKLADITGFCFSWTDYKGDEAELKQEVVNVVSSLMFTHEDLEGEHHLVGVEGHLNTCVDKLEQMSDATSLLCLVGMGGVGKTTLAKVIYNDFVGRKKFQAMSFLEIDGNTPSSTEVGPSLLSRLQKQLLWDLLRVPENSQERYKYWFHKLSRQGPVLVVLDDILDKPQFDKLILNTSLFALGSCIIVTSRDQHLLKVVASGKLPYYIHEVTPLECNDAQKLFNLHAFQNEEAPHDFKGVANDVSNACGGLPLALKVAGSSLFDKTSDEDLEYIWPEAIDALREDPDIMSVLKWSYESLLESEKLMFVDIACVFYGWKKQEALEIWKGCKECSSCCGCGTPHTSLRHLIDKSLVDVEKLNGEDILVMHGLLRDLGQNIGKTNGSHLWDDRATKVVKDQNQGTNKVRALNLASSEKHKFEAENFAKFTNLHYLVLDGCDVIGNLESISKELRWLRWRYMPLTHLPPMLDLSNLITLDFSESTMLANAWVESNPALQACPNLIRLYLKGCTSITTLPDTVRHLSRLQVLDLFCCWNLQQLPSSIGQLIALHKLNVSWCVSLEALPNTITALPKLQELHMVECPSISKLPISMGLMKNLFRLIIDLVNEWLAVGVGQLNALKRLMVRKCTDEAVTMLDTSGALRNLDQLSWFYFFDCPAITKLPESMGMLTRLTLLELYKCEKVRELPNSIEQLKVLTTLRLRKCTNLKTLPDCLGALTSLQSLWVVQCIAITELPTSIGHLASLLELVIQRCDGLQSLPDSLKQLNALYDLSIIGCTNLESVGLLRVLQGFHLWGCTSFITELPRSCLMVVDSNFVNPTLWLDFGEDFHPVWRKLKELQVVEANDCGLLRIVHDDTRSILQRVYKLPCCTTVKKKGNFILP